MGNATINTSKMTMISYTIIVIYNNLLAYVTHLCTFKMHLVIFAEPHFLWCFNIVGTQFFCFTLKHTHKFIRCIFSSVSDNGLVKIWNNAAYNFVCETTCNVLLIGNN